VEDVLDVLGDGTRRDRELRRDLPLVGTAGKHPHHVELPRCQIDPLDGGDRSRTADQPANARHQLVRRERLGDVVVTPDQQARDSDYRDLTVAIFDDDAQIGNDFMPYPTAVEAPAFANSLAAPRANDTNDAFAGNNPGTPILTATAGQPLEVHALVAPDSEQMHIFSLGGLSWSHDRQIANSALFTQRGFGPWETIDADVVGGAGGLNTGRTDGAAGVAFDYFYGDLRRPFTQAGTWGVLRVRVP
jgi:hypothetical protein